MALKKILYTAFVAFLASAGTIKLIAVLSPPPPSAAPAVVSMRELSRHSSKSDCWLAIDGGVYDVTRYVPGHPAPEAALTAWCGREASQAFADKNLGRAHSPAARAMLERFRVGNL